MKVTEKFLDDFVRAAAQAMWDAHEVGPRNPVLEINLYPGGLYDFMLDSAPGWGEYTLGKNGVGYISAAIDADTWEDFRATTKGDAKSWAEYFRCNFKETLRDAARDMMNENADRIREIMGAE